MNSLTLKRTKGILALKEEYENSLVELRKLNKWTDVQQQLEKSVKYLGESLK